MRTIPYFLLLVVLLAGCSPGNANPTPTPALALPAFPPTATATPGLFGYDTRYGYFPLLFQQPGLPPTPTPSATLAPTETAAPTLTPPPTAPLLLPTVQPAYEGCSGSPPLRLQAGGMARVIATRRMSLRVRSAPEFARSNELDQVGGGEVLAVLEGPRCVYNPADGGYYAFWYVRVLSSGLRGWVAENGPEGYYLDPYP
jgi:hypothetical protein